MSHSKELHWFYKPCNEVFHAKTPSHLHFTGKAFLYPFLAALKLYSPLYLVTHIIGRKSFQHLIQKTIPSILRSSSFLSIYGGLFVAMQCTLLSLTHRAYRMYFFGSFFISALISILVEHKGRRQELAVYVFNVGIETIWRMLVDRGVVKPIKHSMGILFAVSWAVLSYYQKHKPECLNNVGAIVKFLNGEEGKPELLERKLSGHSLAMLHQESQNDHVCPHRKHGTRCEVHWITNFSQSFLFGYGLKGLLALASNLLRIRAFNAKTMKDVLMKSFGKQQLRFGLFLGLLSALSRCIKCILRITRGKDDAINTLVAGFIAGLSSYLSSSLEISMYIFAKAIQTVFNHLTMLGKIKPLPYGAELLYSFFTALVFYAGLWEPHNIRPSYLSFLHKITGGLWHEYLTSNKPLREEFQSSAWYAKSLWK
jgi:hypothetical protein